MNLIHIPPLVYLPAPKTVCDCGSPPLLTIKIMGEKCHVQSNSFYLHNQKPIIIQPNTSQTVAFPVTIMSSLPAVSVLTSNAHLYKRKLSYNINIAHTNDSYLELHLFNYTCLPITLNIGELFVHCQVVLLGKPYQIYHHCEEECHT